MPSSQHVLITIRGHDAPGITRDLAQQLAAYDADLLDIEQVVIHDLLLLAFLVRFNDDEKRRDAIEALTQAIKGKDLVIEQRVFTDDDDKRRSQRHTYVVTLLGAVIKPAAVERVANLLAAAGVNIEKINRLTAGAIATIELVVYDAGLVDAAALKSQLYEVSDEFGIDVAVQRESIFRRSKRLVVMDMDSTLISCEVIDELAAAAGAREKVAAITERAMRGELEFADALRERVKSLEGLPQSVMDEIADRIPLTPGAETLVEVLHRLGYKTAVISGGFRYFTDRIQKRLGLTYAHANELEYADGKITGKVKGRIIDATVKAELLEDIARSEGIGLDQVIAIGDGANDMKMLSKAGLGIAFNAKRRVREAAHGTISGSLDSILYLLGISERDIENIKQSTWPK